MNFDIVHFNQFLVFAGLMIAMYSAGMDASDRKKEKLTILIMIAEVVTLIAMLIEGIKIFL